MEFRFNFDNSSEEQLNNDESEMVHMFSPDKTMVISATEVPSVIGTLDIPYKICHLKVGDCQLTYICTEDLQRSLKDTEDNKRIISAITNHSDLIPGIYEGGLKIWECSLDLIHYLDEQKIFTEDMRVLELGCGAGLVGIYAYLKGAKVNFQDFNEEVLRLLTIKNVLLNTDNQDASTMSKHCKFFAGDWDAVNRLFLKFYPTQHKYDVIVTSETIYNPSNQQKLLHLMKNTLKPNGKIYVAAKSYYFGVGGSIQQFEELIKNDNTFDISSCLETAGEIPRKILLLQFKTDFEAIK